jgi:hypothetical protein
MPTINNSEFGSVTVDGQKYNSDVFIHPLGEVEVREKSHEIKKEEIEYLLQDNPDVIVIGKGTSGVAELDEDAKALIKSIDVEVIMGNTPDIREKFNEKAAEKSVAALIHTTC